MGIRDAKRVEIILKASKKYQHKAFGLLDDQVERLKAELKELKNAKKNKKKR